MHGIYRHYDDRYLTALLRLPMSKQAPLALILFKSALRVNVMLPKRPMNMKPDSFDIASFPDVIQVMERVPTLFLPSLTLENIYSFIRAIEVTGKGTPFESADVYMTQFTSFLEVRVNDGYPNNFGWFGIINRKFGNELGARKFFELWSDFLRDSPRMSSKGDAQELV